MTEVEWNNLEEGDLLIPLHKDITSSRPLIVVHSISTIKYTNHINIRIQCIVESPSITFEGKLIKNAGEPWGVIVNRHLYNKVYKIKSINRLDQIEDE